MAEPLSIASGVAGIITLSSAVVAGAYKYIRSVRSAPEELKDLVREISLLYTLISRFVAHTLDADHASHATLDALVKQAVFGDCCATLRIIQTYLDNSQAIHGSHSRNALKALTWPLKKEDVVKGRERIGRLCTLITTATTLDNARSLGNLEKLQRASLEHTMAILKISHSLEERKMLDWLQMHI